MEALETLAVALGFASLAGVNLYLTVLITGLAVNQQWIDFSDKYPELMVLGEPVVLIAAGLFATFEFFSDKIPWLDSAWDSVHTLIRPVGGSLLALSALGPTDPALGVVVAMLAGGTSLMTHGMKAGTRLAINQSPEPVSNTAMSLTEDMAVIGGLALMSVNPLAFAAICLLFLLFSAIMAPKLFRRIKAFGWLLRGKVVSIFRQPRTVDHLRNPISLEDEVALTCMVGIDSKVKWSHPVVLGMKRKFAGVTANTFGKVFYLDSDPGTIHFIGKRNWKRYHSRINLDHLVFTHESKFASENIVLENPETGSRLVLRLPGGSENFASKIVLELTRAQLVEPRLQIGKSPNRPDLSTPIPAT